MSEFEIFEGEGALGYFCVVPSWCGDLEGLLPRVVEELKRAQPDVGGGCRGGLLKLPLIDEGAAEDIETSMGLEVLKVDRKGAQRLLLKYGVLEAPCVILPRQNKVITFRELGASSSFGGDLLEGDNNKVVFDRAMDAYNEFDFTRACNLFSQIATCSTSPPQPEKVDSDVEEKEGESSAAGR